MAHSTLQRHERSARGDGALVAVALPDAVMDRWTFLSTHALVLLCVARDPNMRIREIAHAVGITERAAQRLVADLLAAGYIARTRAGRRNVYQVFPQCPLRHPLERHRDVATLLLLLDRADRPAAHQ